MSDCPCMCHEAGPATEHGHGERCPCKPRGRGTTNGNARGSAKDRAARRAWLMETWASDVEGYVRCYRCGAHLYNPDTPPALVQDVLHAYGPYIATDHLAVVLGIHPLTVDRIIPGCQGGTYRRNNIRPACGRCNSETGGALAGKGKR